MDELKDPLHFSKTLLNCNRVEVFNIHNTKGKGIYKGKITLV